MLDAAGVGSPDHDARVLADHAAATGADLDELVRRRVARVPLQHIIGVAGFRYLELAVGPGVFVPRPETEVVAGVAIELARAARPSRSWSTCAAAPARSRCRSRTRSRAQGCTRSSSSRTRSAGSRATRPTAARQEIPASASIRTTWRRPCLSWTGS